MEDIVRNTGQVGIQALANTLVRQGRTFRVVTGYEHSRQMHRELACFFAAVRVAKAVKSSTLLFVGSAFPMMTDVEADETYLQKRLGPTVRHINADHWNSKYLAVTESDVDIALAECHEVNKVHEIGDDELQRSLRLSIALDQLVRECNGNGGTLNCHVENCLNNPAIGVTACYALGGAESTGKTFHLHRRLTDRIGHDHGQGDQQRGNVHRSSGDG